MRRAGSDGDTQHDDDLPSTDNLKAYGEAMREACELCEKSVDEAIACGQAIADVITRRLIEFAEQTPPPPDEYVQKAHAVATVMRAWMKPLRAAERLIVAVSMDYLEYEGRPTMAMLALLQDGIKKMVRTYQIALSLMSRLAQAETDEERLDIFLNLSEEEHCALGRLRAAQEEGREKLNTLVRCVALIQAEVAGTFGAILEYLVARHLYLSRFIAATPYFEAVPEIEKVRFERSITGVVKASTVALEFLVTKVGPKVLQQIPVVGVGVGAVEVAVEMRRMRQTFLERTCLIQQRNEALIGRNFLWELAYLDGDLKEDAKELEALEKLVDQLGKRLRAVGQALIRDDAWVGQTEAPGCQSAGAGTSASSPVAPRPIAGHRILQRDAQGDFDTLADIMPKDGPLRMLIVGKCPAPLSVRIGHYLQGKMGKSFWGQLTGVGILPVPPAQGFHDDLLCGLRLGITDVVKRPHDTGHEPTRDEYAEGIERILALIEKREPQVVLFIFKRVLDKIIHRQGAAMATLYGFNSGEAIERIFGPSRVFACPLPGVGGLRTAQITTAMEQIRAGLAL